MIRQNNATVVEIQHRNFISERLSRLNPIYIWIYSMLITVIAASLFAYLFFYTRSSADLILDRKFFDSLMYISEDTESEQFKAYCDFICPSLSVFFIGITTLLNNFNEIGESNKFAKEKYSEELSKATETWETKVQELNAITTPNDKKKAEVDILIERLKLAKESMDLKYLSQTKISSTGTVEFRERRASLAAFMQMLEMAKFKEIQEMGVRIASNK